MTPAISVTGLTRRYRGQLTLDRVTFDIASGSITGLLGRNGAGKTTLMRIIAGQEFPSAGSVRVLGASPVENDHILRRMVLIREDQSYPDVKVHHALRAASLFYPNWSSEVADSALAEFGVPPGQAIKKLSRGMRSALGITIGLAARAEVTMLDEPYAGLDPMARQVFYNRLLDDYTACPRTVLLSTHLIDEAAGLLERVLMIDQGRVVLDATADDLRGVATRVSGPVLAVEEFTAGYPVWDRRCMGSQASVVIFGQLCGADRAPARTSHLTLESLSLQELVVHAANHPAPGPRATHPVPAPRTRTGA
jgi:ABC-2 type transport system ATP-binding protein